MINVNVSGGELSKEEIEKYIQRAKEKYPNSQINSIDINVDGDFVDINYNVSPVPFERIRRITGYLVGTMDRWNDAKSAEEAQRVKHSV